MHRFVLSCLFALALPAAATAQSVLGILNRTNTSFTSRGSAGTPNTNLSVSFARLDKEAYAGWGVDPANPGMRQILGISGALQDQIGNTPETYGLLVYTEDPANPNYPDMTTPLGSLANLPTPASTATGATAFTFTATFTTPILAPASGDVFLGVEMPQPIGNTWPTDGLSCHALYYVTVTSGISDLPGASHPTTQPEVGNGGWYVAPPAYTSGPTYTTTPRQWKLEPIVAGAAGVAGTITNQSTAPLSNVAPGTSSQASGLHPDAVNPPLNLNRADDICSRWFMSSAPNNTAVFFLASFNPFFTEVPVATFVPGGIGTICIDPTALHVLGLRFTTSGEAFYAWSFPPTARNVLAGVGITHQSIGLDPVTGAANANGCTRQIL